MHRISLFVVLEIAIAHLCTAQVQVSEEPRHHDVLDNSWVRILDVHIPPGDTSLFHKHSTPSVFLILSNTKTGSEVLVEPRKLSFAPGNIFFEGFYDKPRIHRVWNADTIEFHAMDIELPHANPQTIDPPIGQPSFSLLFDDKPVRGYRVNLASGQSFRLAHRKSPVVIIGLSDSVRDVKVNATGFGKKGDYLFLPAGTDMDFANKGTLNMQFAFFELK